MSGKQPISTAHRPWPPPPRPWIMRQVWHDLLFAHWPMPPAAIRQLLPSSVELDLFEGQAWLAIVPFRMSDIGVRHVFPLPGLSSTPELNVRTYVTCRNKRGVWFLSLDAASSIAVWAARRFFHLPYYRARMSVRRQGNVIQYESERVQTSGVPARFRATYQPTGSFTASRPGSLAHWLTERYCLYTTDSAGTLLRCEILHAPWPLQPDSGRFEVNSMTDPLGLLLPATAPLLHFARCLEVLAWSIEPV